VGKTPIYNFSTFGSKINEFERKKSEKNKKIPETQKLQAITLTFTLVIQFFYIKIKIINFKNSDFCCFQPSILKRPKGQKYFYGRFHSSLALLINH
jgi:hypothetical protein